MRGARLVQERTAARSEGAVRRSRPAGAGERPPPSDGPRASRALTLLTAAAALSLGWMIVHDHVAPNLRTRSGAPVQAVEAVLEPEAAPSAGRRRRGPLLTGEAARRALAAEAREDVRRRFERPSFPPGEEPAL